MSPIAKFAGFMLVFGLVDAACVAAVSLSQDVFPWDIPALAGMAVFLGIAWMGWPRA